MLKWCTRDLGPALWSWFVLCAHEGKTCRHWRVCTQSADQGRIEQGPSRNLHQGANPVMTTCLTGHILDPVQRVRSSGHESMCTADGSGGDSFDWDWGRREAAGWGGGVGGVHREDTGYTLNLTLSYKEITLHELPGAVKKMRRLKVFVPLALTPEY